jgi:DNA-binding CsgD family transcriptional regulator
MQTDTQQDSKQVDEQVEIQPTPAQRQILQYLANGCNQKQVSQVMGISHETIRTQLKLIRIRLRVNTVEQAVALVTKRGWITVDDYPRRALQYSQNGYRHTGTP